MHPQRDVVRIAPVGELDLATVAKLRAHLDELHAAGFKHVVLDLRQLAFMDCIGVRLILAEDRLARESGGRFSVIKGGRAVQRVLDLCGLTDELEIAGSELARRPRQAGLERPDLGMALQCHLAGLRQQRASSRRTTADRRPAPAPSSQPSPPTARAPRFGAIPPV
ncbi:MAG: STAS domain-containing protein [Actinobacteria bacterium]|nr:STAS domain-containing protein [Actinomycetota bacterium]